AARFRRTRPVPAPPRPGRRWRCGPLPPFPTRCSCRPPVSKRRTVAASTVPSVTPAGPPAAKCPAGRFLQVTCNSYRGRWRTAGTFARATRAAPAPDAVPAFLARDLLHWGSRQHEPRGSREGGSLEEVSLIAALDGHGAGTGRVQHDARRRRGRRGGR